MNWRASLLKEYLSETREVLESLLYFLNLGDLKRSQNLLEHFMCLSEKYKLLTKYTED